MIFFTADSHFGHTNIIKYCNRPFSSAEQMDAMIIKNINDKVAHNDILYHLGDFSFRNVAEYRNRINCRHIHLILGNHDRENRSVYTMNFETVDYYKSIRWRNSYRDNPTTIIMCHYAMRVWNKSHHDSWMLYGHSHGTLKDEGYKSFDVGVDCWHYGPISVEDVDKEMNKRKTKAVDHHTASL